MIQIEVEIDVKHIDPGRCCRRPLTSFDLNVVPRVGELLKLDLGDSTDHYLVKRVVHEIEHVRAMRLAPAQDTHLVRLLVEKVSL